MFTKYSGIETGLLNRVKNLEGANIMRVCQCFQCHASCSVQTWAANSPCSIEESDHLGNPRAGARNNHGQI